MIGQVERNAFVMDSNSFIEPYRLYYSFDHFPAYWDWLKKMIVSASPSVIVPKVVYNELANSGDRLAKWLSSKEIKPYIYSDYENDTHVWDYYGKIASYIHTSGLYCEPGLSNWDQAGKADPLLIAMAAANKWEIVTREVPNNGLSKKQQTKKEPKIPDVAKVFDVTCVSLFDLEDICGLRIKLPAR
ncbi:DUF4411 family protein [Schleiferilactobacillus harbinensis]|uniref:DUF4411 family protein n=1 Tax=Schleiferilactobacillus harbinensis TaxID=304207 RepID=A0ABU7T2W7_9LACO